MLKKILYPGIVLSFCAGFLFAQTAVAPNGSGTSGDPYQIETLDNLYWVSQNSSAWDKYFIQTANIDASETSSWNSGAGWAPIGNSSTSFTGSYDGNSKIISGLFINRPNNNYVAFFGKAEGATIENLRLFDASVTGDTYCAVLTGVSKQTVTNNCGTSGSVTCDQIGGGLIGTNYNYSTIDDSYSEASVTGPTNDGHYRFGGLVGVNSTYSTITNSYARGSVTGYQYVGGFVGFNGELYYVANDNSKVEKCYSTGRVTGTLHRGGFCGINDDGCYINMCFWDYQTANEQYSPYGMEKTTAEMKTQSTFTNYGWNFSSIWTMNSDYNSGYPVQIWQTLDPSRTSEAPTGLGTTEDPYQIASLDNLYWIAEDNSRWSSHYIQTADIDASVTSSWYVGQGWSPIGNYTVKFTGSYDGQGYHIDNVFINRPSGTYTGLFGYVQSGSISNVNIRTSDVTGQNFTGGLVGYTYYQASIENCSYSGDVAGGQYVGGLVGQNYYESDINNCHSAGTVTGSVSQIGGLIGYNNYHCEVNNCYSRSDVNGGSDVGGFAGKHYYSDLNNCYSTGSVSGSSNTGGLVGEANINYSTVVSDCFWDTETSGLSNSDGGTGKTTADMKTSTTFTNAGWDLILTWGRNDDSNDGYPFIRTEAEEETPSIGDGSEGSPYQISTSGNLYWLSQHSDMWDKYFIQTADIDLSISPAWTTAEGFLPIGNSTIKFTGSYNGQGYSINALYINRTTTDYNGLFGYIYTGARISDVHLTNTDITGYNNYTGSLAGRIYNSTIEKCSSLGSVEGKSYNGVLIGYAYNSPTSKCYSSGTVTGSGNYTGGLIGYTSESTVTECYSSASVTSSSDYVGGLVGFNDETAITNCYSNGSVYGNDNVGGLLGYNGTYGVVSHCYSSGAVSNNGNALGGLVGYNSTINYAKVYNSYWDTETSGQAISADGTGKTTVEMQTQSTFDDQGWSFIHTWAIDDGYPYLQQRPNPPMASAPAEGDGSEGSPYEISTLSELYWITQDAARWSLHYVQTADIDAIQTGALVNGWSPIGNNETKFTGSFDGQGYNISNIYIFRRDESHIGLFGYIDNALIYDTHLINAEITGDDYAGDLAGYISYSTVEKCSAHGSIDGGNDAGSLIGYATYSTISKCNSSGIVIRSGNYTGGLVGYISYSTVAECYSSASVRCSYDHVGGLVGSSSNSTIMNSFSTGLILGDDNVGGLVGFNGTRSTVTHCFSTGAVSNTGNNVGGLVGENSTINYAKVLNSYWDTETSGQTASSGGTGKTTADMQTQSTFDDQGWSFIHTWSIDGGYPYLQQRLNPPMASAPVTGDGSEGSPYEISTLSELYWITQDAARWSLHYVQTADIDAIRTGALISGWTSIGNETSKFTGSYDGQGYNISNVYIFGQNTTHIGLFGYIDNALIYDTHLINAEITGDDYAGELAGFISYSTVEKCSAHGSIDGDAYTGGLIGRVNYSTTKECTSSGMVVRSGNYSGGLVGYIYYSNVTECYSSASVTCSYDHVGGLVGSNSYSTIMNSYCTGSVHGDDNVGGLLGYNGSRATVTQCYSTGAVSNSGNDLGGLVGENSTINYAKVLNSYWDTETSGLATSSGGTGKTTAEMKTQSTFDDTDWDFVSTWLMHQAVNTGYPALQWQIDPVSPVIVTGSIVELAKDSARIQYTISEPGLPKAYQYGVCWDTTGVPDISGQLTNEGPADSSGIYTSLISGLTSNTFYVARPYIMSNVDTVYGDTLSFKTPGSPSVANIAVTNIDSNKATANAEITALGNPAITEHGFAWAFDADSVTTFNKVLLGSASALGDFNSEIGDLIPGSSYKLFAFAYNSIDSAYTDTLTFFTLNLPEVTTISVSEIDTHQVTVNASLKDPGNPRVSQYGICWSTAIDPTIEDNKVELGSSDTAKIFNYQINELTENTRYYVRAYATNSLGTVYGDTLDFVTLGNSSISPVAVTEIDTSSAKLSAEIFSLGNPAPTGHGFLWSMDDGSNTFNREHLGAVDSTGIFTTVVSGLQPNTDYISFAYIATPGDTIFTDTSGFKTLGYPVVTTLSVDNIGMTTASVNALIDDPGNPTAIQYGVCWSTAIDPSIEDRKVELGPIDSVAAYTAVIDSLERNTLYFIRSFAMNDIGVVYGDTLSFTTLGLPSVEGLNVSEIDTARIIANAEITSLGNPSISQHGFAWAMETDTVLAFHQVYLGVPDSIGTFSAAIGSLRSNSAYHLYAFVSNANDTVCTDTIMFRTYGLPSVSMLSVTDLDSIKVIAGGQIEDLGNPGIIHHGFCWSTGKNPTIEDNSLDLGAIDSLTGFSSGIDSLIQNTRYYIRAFATNGVGTVYSDTLSFMTLETSIFDMIPKEFTLVQNYPNPFNPRTTLQYGLPDVSDVKLVIFDILGRKVREWSFNGQDAGWYTIIWNGSDNRGNIVSTGVYIYLLKAGDFVESKKMVFMK